MAGIPFIDSSHEDVLLCIRRLTDARGADVVFDTVGGSMLLEALKILAPRGRVIEISADRNPNVTINLRDFYHQQDRLIGVDSLSLDAVQCAQILRDLSSGFDTGELAPPPIAATYPLDQAIQAYEAVDAGRGEGRHVLVQNA
jgi:NADPH:quinone reductase-like Zn-dependent oxidoreductase